MADQDFFQIELAAQLVGLEQRGLRRRQRTVAPLPNGQCRISDQILWNFAANDYLGLADDPRLAQAAIAAIEESGIGARASPLVTGRTVWHEQLEQQICRFKKCEAAILFPTGYAANVGTIAALVGSEDVIICDRLNHASLIDGARLSRAKFQVVKHADPEAYRKVLLKLPASGRRLIITDSIFSMDGDHAPLRELAELATEFSALLLVDEAHATGVCGEHGTGLLEAQGVVSDRVIAVGTLSKAIGLQGGFVAGSRLLIDWLWNSARTQMFSTGLNVSACAAAVAAFDIIQAEPERRRWLEVASRDAIGALREQGWNVPASARGPIIPVIVGEEADTIRLAGILEQQGMLVAAIRPPTVPHGTSRLRISISYAHQQPGIEALMAAFLDLKKHRVD